MHKFIFELNTKTESIYYIKEYLTELNVSIITTKLNILKNKIEIYYKIIDNDNNYKYVLELE